MTFSFLSNNMPSTVFLYTLYNAVSTDIRPGGEVFPLPVHTDANIVKRFHWNFPVVEQILSEDCSFPEIDAV